MEKSCDFIALGLYFGMWLERGRNVPNSHGPIFWNVAAMVAGTFQIHTYFGMWLERDRNVPNSHIFWNWAGAFQNHIWNVAGTWQECSPK